MFKSDSIVQIKFLGYLVVIAILLFTPLKVIYETTQVYSVVNAIDNDAAAAVITTLNTSWTTDNKNYSYGPLYYRISATVANILGFEIFNNLSQGVHFSLVLVSYLSFLGICLLLSIVAFKNLEARLLGFICLFCIFLSSFTWVKYIFTAHPDMLKSALIVLTFYLIYKFQSQLEKKRYIVLSGIVYGCALASKSSAGIFIISIILFYSLFVKMTKRSIALLVMTSIISAISYLLVGWPQTGEINKTLDFLEFAQNRIGNSPDWSSVIG